LRSAKELGEKLSSGSASEQRTILLELVARIVVADETITIVLRASALSAGLGIPECERRPDDGGEFVLELPVAFRRRGVETKLIIGEGGQAVTAPDPNLVGLLVQAQQWFAELRADNELSVITLAKRHRVDSGDMSRTLPLTFLAPDIVEAILDGHQPSELTAARLKRVKQLPLSWRRQREMLRFA